MIWLLTKIPFLIELIFNGVYILVYSMRKFKQLPSEWSEHLIDNIIAGYSWIIPIILFITLVLHYLENDKVEDFFRKYIFSILIFVPLVITWGDIEFAYWLSIVHLLFSVLTFYDLNTQPKNHRSRSLVEDKKISLSPKKIPFSSAQIVVLSFGVFITIMTFLLMLPISGANGYIVSFIDALFMVTSATCVTGLATISVKSDLSVFGQLVLLACMQIGGLGVMTLSASVGILLGREMPMKERLVMQDLVSAYDLESLLELVLDILKYTLVIEFGGAIILTISFLYDGFEFGTALYMGIYHSISAFCNAGISLFDNNLESYATNSTVSFTVSFLIIFGGIGFTVLRDLARIFVQKKSLKNLEVHTKIVVITSFMLIAIGTVIIFFGEFLNSLDGYTLWEKFTISFFQSVTTRTAGFNTIPLINFHTYVIFFMILLMFIGASPASTGGGIKTSTFAIMIQSIIATMKGNSRVEFFNRRASESLVVKAVAISIISMIIVTFFVFMMMKIEPEQTFLTIMFEVVSAFGTVGLSLGITPYLSVSGKLLITLLMFIGRVGPLTLFLAIGEQKVSKGKIEYPEGQIMIG
ncbi:MAG: TrkH family potassium uptake protein [Bacteriovoracaceae bacterium]